jgi:hypothetical protein
MTRHIHRLDEIIDYPFRSTQTLRLTESSLSQAIEDPNRQEDLKDLKKMLEALRIELGRRERNRGWGSELNR